MSNSSTGRVTSTILVILVPIIVVPLVVVSVLHQHHVAGPVNVLTIPVIWVVGLVWVWRPGRRGGRSTP